MSNTSLYKFCILEAVKGLRFKRLFCGLTSILLIMICFPFLAILAIIVGLCLIVYVRSYFLSVDTLPKLYYKESVLNTHLLKKTSILRRPFRPRGWLNYSHIQTILGIARPKPEVKFEREYLQMADKGVVALDWVVNNTFLLKRYSPILLIFPALTGDAKSASSICDYAGRKGFRIVIFNSRGHGKSFLTTKRLQGFGDPLDVRQSVIYIRQKHPKANVAAVAIGTGSTTLFSYLGEYGSSARLKAAAFVSPIYDTTDILTNDNTVPKIYQLLFLLGLKRILLRHAQPLSDNLDVTTAILQTWSLSKYVEQIYCVLGGVAGKDSLESFLERNNPMRDVDDIAVPVLCINSKDDPICTNDSVPFDIFQFYPNMLLVSTKGGGHCGFLEDLFSTSWADKMAIDYLQVVLDFTSHSGKCYS